VGVWVGLIVCVFVCLCVRVCVGGWVYMWGWEGRAFIFYLCLVILLFLSCEALWAASSYV